MKIEHLKNELSSHACYQKLESLNALRSFMETHVFAVWDFMSLLKSLQQKITCTSLPWSPSIYDKKLVRLINEIVLGEESDLKPDGSYSDHFSLYLEAMKEVGANTSHISDFLANPEPKKLPPSIRQFVEFNLELALKGEVHEVAAAFFHGREGLIPSMFTSIKEVLEVSKIEAPSLLYYLERHIEVDGGKHGPMGEELLNILYEGQIERISQGNQVAQESLHRRKLLWDSLL